mmetsp:Transcript_38637/g.114747  ORF Transcript_38637/g.114747 Transcript_38637/m.114747 type:complete len:293 (-) Transcript_38637:3440-4318(-)
MKARTPMPAADVGRRRGAVPNAMGPCCCCWWCFAAADIGRCVPAVPGRRLLGPCRLTAHAASRSWASNRSLLAATATAPPVPAVPPCAASLPSPNRPLPSSPSSSSSATVALSSVLLVVASAARCRSKSALATAICPISAATRSRSTPISSCSTRAGLPRATLPGAAPPAARCGRGGGAVAAAALDGRVPAGEDAHADVGRLPADPCIQPGREPTAAGLLEPPGRAPPHVPPLGSPLTGYADPGRDGTTRPAMLDTPAPSPPVAGGAAGNGSCVPPLCAKTPPPRERASRIL